MKFTFPENFLFGTSTSAYQIETAFNHDWLDVLARDGKRFNKTTDHELFFEEDIKIIASLAPNYRMGVMWSKLQHEPLGEFDTEVVAQYKRLFEGLKENRVNVMMVLHHFANPIWFAKLGGWENETNVALWVDYAKKVVDHFGDYIHSWNTFNEPNLYTSLGWVASEFPPFKRNVFLARKVIRNIGTAHEILYDYIKRKYPDSLIGISHNCTVFEALNFAGKLPAKLFDYYFMEYPLQHFKSLDFFGMSYYARIAFDPFPITFLQTPHKIKALSMNHDDIWEYYPEGLKICMHRYWEEYKKPIIITENGICTNDDEKRIAAIKDYLQKIQEAIDEGVEVRGYYHWSTWDNFEWSLGPSFKFGLYGCNYETMERFRKPSAELYSKIAFGKELVLS